MDTKKKNMVNSNLTPLVQRVYLHSEELSITNTKTYRHGLLQLVVM